MLSTLPPPSKTPHLRLYQSYVDLKNAINGDLMILKSHVDIIEQGQRVGSFSPRTSASTLNRLTDVQLEQIKSAQERLQVALKTLSSLINALNRALRHEVSIYESRRKMSNSPTVSPKPAVYRLLRGLLESVKDLLLEGKSHFHLLSTVRHFLVSVVHCCCSVSVGKASGLGAERVLITCARFLSSIVMLLRQFCF